MHRQFLIRSHVNLRLGSQEVVVVVVVVVYSSIYRSTMAGRDIKKRKKGYDTITDDNRSK